MEPDTTRARARELLERALTLCPQLTHHGFGVYGGSHLTLHERTDRLRLEREEFEGCVNGTYVHADTILDEIRHAADFTRRLKPISTYNRRCTSYGLKHGVESWWAARRGRHATYVANGSFIAAAVGLGYRSLRVGDSLNCHFDISNRSLREISLETIRLNDQSSPRPRPNYDYELFCDTCGCAYAPRSKTTLGFGRRDGEHCLDQSGGRNTHDHPCNGVVRWEIYNGDVQSRQASSL